MKLKAYFNQLKKWVVIFQNFGICKFIIKNLFAILAVSISCLSFCNSNKQFKSNTFKSDSIFKVQLSKEKLASHKADSLFNVQLSNEKQTSHMTDSIYRLQLNNQIKNLMILEKMKGQTEQQIKIVSQQLTISSKTYDDMINSGKPIIISYLNRFYDTIKPYPKLEIIIKNTGKRTAFNVKSRKFYLSNTYKVVSYNLNDSDLKEIGPEQNITITDSPDIKNLDIKSPFFYCMDLRWKDYQSVNNVNAYRPDSLLLILEYHKSIDKLNLLYVNDVNRKIILKKINSVLKLNKEPLFVIQ